MMAMTRMFAVPSLVLALGLIGAPAAHAAAISINAVGVVNATYDAATDTTTPTDTVTGPDVIKFESVDTGTVEFNGVVRLGQLDIRPVPGTASTYNDTPFDIKVTMATSGDSGSTPTLGADTQSGVFHLLGRISGTVADTGAMNLIMYFDSVTKGTVNGMPFPAADVKLSGPILVRTAPSSGSHAVAVEVQLVPEPASIAVFILAAAGLAYRKVRRTASV